MAHFAEINENNVVLRVLVVPDKQELRGQSFLAEDLGLGGTWVKTSYNGNIRYNYATVGGIYDPELDAFYEPQPYPSWTLDSKCVWKAPKQKPDNDNLYSWNEELLDWEKVNA